MNKVTASLAIICIVLTVFAGFCVINIIGKQNIIDISKHEQIADKEIVYLRSNDAKKFVVDCEYAGYIFVRIDSSTTRYNYVNVDYTSKAGSSAHIVTYSHRENLSQGEWACFPVLPGGVTIHVGNTEWYNDVTQTVTIEYWY
ncbi:MAG: hypothetical protein LBE70_02010 [Nitrososphaerota archaeon]|jgi:hypothetical protein|nr:hypothetical protein [Nitrososphaerota archaeon]